MPFEKRDPSGEMLYANFSIQGPDYYITNQNYQDYTFPVDGWDWVEVTPEPLPAHIAEAIDAIAAHYALSPKKVEKLIKELEHEQEDPPS